MEADPKTLELEKAAPQRSMQRIVREFVDARNADCMDVMREYQDGHFDLAIVDPPYGLSCDKMRMGDGYYGKGRKDRLSQGAGKLKTRILQFGQSEWDANPPTSEYFAELRRVTRNQIIWGGNYFPLPPTRCVVSWDKEQPWPNFSAWEMAWTSFDMPAKLFRWNNQGPGNPGKIHPTQKPVELYKWLLNTFAKPGQRILDTHMGSGSIGIACHYYACPLVACEIDPAYFHAACERIERETAQTDWYLPTTEDAP
jgi:site-specific DNA-methyltransferase (adenine-specific)